LKRKPFKANTRLLTQIAAVVLCITMCSTTFAIHALAQKDNQLSYTFNYTTPTLSSETLFNTAFTKLSMTNTILAGTSGEPALPRSAIQMVLPPDTTVESITVTGPSVEVQTSIDLAAQPVKPYQNPLPFGTPMPTTIAYNQQLYQTCAAYPQTPYNGEYQLGYCRGYTIVSLSLEPVQYLPTQGKLLYYTQLTVTVNLKTTTSNNLYRNSADDKAWVQSLVCNPSVADQYTSQSNGVLEYPGGLCSPGTTHQYVIITTTQNGLNDWDAGGTTPNNWDTLIAAHSDLSPIVVTKQDITACSAYFNTTSLFNDTQAKIREFCKDAYQDWGTEYVLICGDADTMAARQMYTQAEGGNVDADIYWSNLDLNFNANQNSQWGEEGDAGFDLYSELYVGRLTADTPQDVSNWMTKSLKYAAEGDPGILDNAAFYGGDTGWNCQGDDFEDFSGVKGTNNWLGPSPGSEGPWPSFFGFLYGFETFNQIYPGIPFNMSNEWTMEPPNPGWQGNGETGLRNAINADQVSIISGIAHANEHMSLDVYDTDWESSYHNTHPFFLTDYGCHCGDFDASDDGILDVMLFTSDTYRSFGCVFNTGYGWGQFDDTNSSSAVQQKMFWDYFFDVQNNSGSIASWQAGKGHAFSKDEMAPTINWDSSFRETIQCMLLFGDPAQMIKPPRTNDGPSDPSTPVGPAEGSVAISYSFTTSTTDPDNDPLYYLFDWGDGTNSGWVGPFDSGTTGTGSHIWTSGGTFDVKVQAKDFIGATTGWSGTTQITIGAPILEIQKVKGGVGVKMILNNKGEGSAVVDWRVTITGKMLSLQNVGHIGALPAGEPTTVKLYPAFFGIGMVKINIKTSAIYGNALDENYKALVLAGLVIPLGSA